MSTPQIDTGSHSGDRSKDIIELKNELKKELSDLKKTITTVMETIKPIVVAEDEEEEDESVLETIVSKTLVEFNQYSEELEKENAARTGFEERHEDEEEEEEEVEVEEEYDAEVVIHESQPEGFDKITSNGKEYVFDEKLKCYVPLESDDFISPRKENLMKVEDSNKRIKIDT
jgi:hypothetical protein